MDLKRVAVAYNGGSVPMAKRFSDEALKRKEEVNMVTVKPYIRVLLTKLDRILIDGDVKKIAEDSLMVSTLLQNYTQTAL